MGELEQRSKDGESVLHLLVKLARIARQQSQLQRLDISAASGMVAMQMEEFF